MFKKDSGQKYHERKRLYVIIVIKRVISNSISGKDNCNVIKEDDNIDTAFEITKKISRYNLDSPFWILEQSKT